jgi:hypothetical protein
MEEGDRPEDEAPPSRPKRRRRPPTLELKATEVGDQSAATEAPQAKSSEAPKAGERRPSDSIDWRAMLTNAQVTGAVGVLAGAVLVFALMTLFGGRGGGDARVTDLSNEMKSLSSRIEMLANRPLPPSDAAGLAQRIDRLTAAIGDTEQRLISIERRPVPQAPDLSTVHQRTAAIETAIRDLRGALTDLRRVAEQAPPAAMPQAIDALTSRIGGLEERISALAAPRAAASTASLAGEIAALNALSDVLKSGLPFVKELEAARVQLGDRAAPLALLEPYAGKGIATPSALAESLSQLAPQLTRPPSADTSVLGRLLENAARLVDVRPVGEPEGKSAGAVVARAETKLARGDVAGALAEFEQLPDNAKAAAATWIAAATQRRDAERTVRQLIDAALANSAGRKQS